MRNASILHALFPVLFFALSPLSASTPPHPHLMQDSWRDDRPNDDVTTLRHWLRLSEPDTGRIQRHDGRNILLLEKSGRVRSLRTAPYLDGFTLTTSLSLDGGTGAAGFGFIDFSTNIYYYLFVDASGGRLVLQRGDGTDTEELASTPFQPGDTARSYSLGVDLSSAHEITLRVLVDGAALEASEPRPDKLGSVFHIYCGTGTDTIARVHEITTVRPIRR